MEEIKLSLFVYNRIIYIYIKLAGILIGITLDLYTTWGELAYLLFESSHP